MSINVFALRGKWYVEIDGKRHPRRFDTYQDAANVAEVADKWVGTPDHKPGRTDFSPHAWG